MQRFLATSSTRRSSQINDAIQSNASAISAPDAFTLPLSRILPLSAFVPLSMTTNALFQFSEGAIRRLHRLLSRQKLLKNSTTSLHIVLKILSKIFNETLAFRLTTKKHFAPKTKR